MRHDRQAVPIAAHPTVGHVLAGYRIDGFVGRGGMGEVYRALDVRLERPVALKLVAPQFAADERFRQRFLVESRLAARLDHPNVIPVYEAGEAEGRLFLAMRLVDGSDLRRMLLDEGRLEPARALALLAPVAGALDTAHARGLVHRDVKPSNVLIAVDPDADPPEHVYLSDFGLTSTTAEHGEGGFSGTAEYAAPELVTGGPVDSSSDVYALGCVLFECLAGEPPFAANSVMGVLWAHLNDPVPSARARNPALPSAVDSVLERALAKEPARRHPSCRALVESARDALAVTGIEVPVVAQRRRAVVGLALAAALGAAAAALALLLTRGGGAVDPQAGRLWRIDPLSNTASETVRVGRSPNFVAVGDGYVWATSRLDAAVWRVDTDTLAVRRVSITGTSGGPNGVTVEDHVAYIANGAYSPGVTRIDARSAEPLVPAVPNDMVSGIASGDGGVWIAGYNLVVTAPIEAVRLGGAPTGSEPGVAWRTYLRSPIYCCPSDLAVGEGGVWVVGGDAFGSRLWRLDPRSGRLVSSVRLPLVAPAGVAVGAGSVWVTDAVDDALVRIDPAMSRVTARIRVGRLPTGIAVGAGAVWVTAAIERTVTRIDPRTNRVVATIPVPTSPTDVAVGEGSVWVTADAS